MFVIGPSHLYHAPMRSVQIKQRSLRHDLGPRGGPVVEVEGLRARLSPAAAGFANIPLWAPARAGQAGPSPPRVSLYRVLVQTV